jgi:type IV secretory pathway VirB3-like protein
VIVLSQETKVLLLLGTIVLLVAYEVCRDDPRCWRWIRRRYHQQRVWRDLQNRRGKSMRPANERSKNVMP